VEEYGDEEEELYDEFVSPIPHPIQQNYHNRDRMSQSEGNEEVGLPVAQSLIEPPPGLRFSGMSALQDYLEGELKMSSGEEMSSSPTSSSIPFKIRSEGVPAVNRLGRSLAVDKLESLLK